MRRSFHTLLKGVLFLLVVIAVSVQAAESTQYTINLLSSLEPIDLAQYQVPGDLSMYRLYTTEIDHKGQHWYRLRLGLFDDRRSATAALNSLRPKFGDAWLARAAKVDEISAGAQALPAPARVPEPVIVAVKPAVVKPEPELPIPQLVAASAQVPQAERRYVISLAISVDPIHDTKVPELDSVPGIRIYTTDMEQRGNKWYFLRAGFFATHEEAEALLPRVAQRFPEAKVMKITRYELAQVTGQRTFATAGAVTQTALEQTTVRNRLLEQARVAMVQGEYDTAVSLYQQVIEEGDADSARQAQELLGVAYERRGDMHLAQTAYRRFLELYPRGEDADRVRQRLSAIETATEDPRAALKTVKKRSTPTQTYLYGSFAAIYRRDANISSTQQGETVNQSALTSYLDVTGRVRSGAYDSRVRFTGSHRSDLLTNGPGDENRISSMYADINQRDADWSVRLGRQSSSTGGVQGRFDGLFGGMRVSPKLRLNAVAGYPVESTADNAINQHKNFYGLSADLNGLAENWEFQLYGIQQRDDGYVDRQAVGGEARYFTPGRTFFGLLDYDTYFKTMNTAMMLGTWSFSDSTSVNLMLDKRKSPSLMLSNSLQGQLTGTGMPIMTLDELSTTYSVGQMRQLALDRTADSQTVMVGLAHTLNERYRMTVDLTASEIGATPASGGVAATDATGMQYYLSAQLIGRSMLWQDDLSIVGLTLSTTQTLDSVGVNFNSRIPRGHWQFNPRASLQYRDDSGAGEKYVVFRPSAIVTYNRWRNHTFDMEAGGEFTSRANVPQGYFVSLSYRWDF